MTKFNPFTTRTEDASPLFYSYVKWNGRTDSYMGDTKGLEHNRIYKVVTANIQSWTTTLYLLDVSTGNLVSDNGFNSCYFTHVPTYWGIAKKNPKIGERFNLQKFNGSKFEGWNTSPVIGIECLSPTTKVVITRNSVYIVHLQ